MNLNLVSRLVAIAIGAVLLLNAVSRSAILIERRGLDFDLAYLIAVVLPVVVAAVLGSAVFLYARRLQFDDEELAGVGLLSAGVKLLGIYLIVLSAPGLIGALVMFREIFAGAAEATTVIRNVIVASLYLVAGVVFALRTGWLLAFLARDT